MVRSRCYDHAPRDTVPADTSDRQPPDTDRAPVRVGRVERRARSRRVRRRIAWAGAGLATLTLGAVLATGVAAQPHAPALVTPAAAARPPATTNTVVRDAQVGAWRMAAPVLLLTAGTTDPVAPNAEEVPATGPASDAEAISPARTLPTAQRAGPTGLVSVEVAVHDPGTQPAAASGTADGASAGSDGAPGGRSARRGTDASSGFATVDVTVSEAHDVVDTTAALADLEPFAYRDNDDGTIAIDAGWVARNIVTTDVPLIGPVRCHTAMIEPLTDALRRIVEDGLAGSIDAADYGGCWVPRRIDSDPDKPLSMHAWGLAIDLNVATNALGAPPTLDPRVVAIFREAGFHWGGDWSRPDGMHFELLGRG